MGDTTAVGSYPSGASWVGALDLAGNVGEFVKDWYGAYSAKSQTNPTGPDSGVSRVTRGGSWGDDQSFTRVTRRITIVPDFRYDFEGFRCVRRFP